MNGAHGFWGGGFMGLIELGLILLLVFIVVMAIRGGSPRPPADEAKTPLEILRERYARGEIDEETFERMKKALRED